MSQPLSFHPSANIAELRESVTIAVSQRRDIAWLTRAIPEGAHLHARDITSGLTMLALMGPKSRDLLRQLSPADLSEAAFPFGTSTRPRNPASAAYDASDDEVLPVEAHATADARIRCACVIAAVIPRSLNDPLGL